MKRYREVKGSESIRKARGVLVLGHKAPQKESKEDTTMRQAFKHEAYLRIYFQVGNVYSFTVGTCISDQKTDGSQQTRYTVKDKRGEKHFYYCDCTRYKFNQEIFLRIKEICNGQLKFESSVIERLDEIFIKGEEYEFEVISYQKEKGCYVVCDNQIGKNHFLRANADQLYKKREILKLEVQGYDDKGGLVLVDRNPPAPQEPWKNSLQLIAESIAESQKSVTPSVPKKQKLPKSARQRGNQYDLSDTPKVAPSIAIPREDKIVLVEDLGYKKPSKAEKYVTRLSEAQPVYTRSIKQVSEKQKFESLNQPEAKPRLNLHSEAQPRPQPNSHTNLPPEVQPEAQPDLQSKQNSEAQPELQPDSQPYKTLFFHSFMAWMDGVQGMEKTEDYTVYSGHAEEVEVTVLPSYYPQVVSVGETMEEHEPVKPWYIRVWQLIKRCFGIN